MSQGRSGTVPSGLEAPNSGLLTDLIVEKEGFETTMGVGDWPTDPRLFWRRGGPSEVADGLIGHENIALARLCALVLSKDGFASSVERRSASS